MKAKSFNCEKWGHISSVQASHPAAPGLSTQTHLVVLKQGILRMQLAAKAWNKYYNKKLWQVLPSKIVLCLMEPDWKYADLAQICTTLDF